MAGAGFDARMIGAADGPLKDRFGRLAYVWTGAKSVRVKPFEAKIEVDGKKWFRGKASCILVGNVGHLFGGVEAFEDAEPDDGAFELGVVTADGAVAWMRTIARAAIDTASASPYTETTKAREIRIRLDRKVPYELDGGDRTKARDLRIKIEPGAVRVAVPGEAASAA
jgi:diacylglycerol kinase family enzyme